MTDLIGGMKGEEVAMLEAYYQKLKEGEADKRLQLFCLLKDGKVSNDAEACQKLYGKDFTTAYSKLKEKLTYDICRIILLQNPDNLTKFRGIGEAIKCRVLLSVGQVMIVRNAEEGGLNLLKKAYKNAEKFELIPELISIIEELAVTMGYNHGWETHKEYIDQAFSYLMELREVLFAKRYYYNVHLPNFFKKHKEQS